MSDRVLLISDNDHIIEDVKIIISRVAPTVSIDEAKSTKEAIDKILNNGFVLTILDSRLNQGEYDISTIIKLNFTSSKNLIVLSNKSITKKLEKIFQKPINDVPRVLNMVGKTTDKKFRLYMDRLKNLGEPTPTETFETLYADIQQTKQSFFVKYPFFQIF